ncbi:MAG: tetratricopeptide repeat protein [Candidatus Aminicenantes bacterium]|jgi:tetratricopeptide (TPR) repeat protein
MTTENGSTVTFFKNLLNRRVPQIAGIYLGVGWGIVQFIDWIVNRYLLSPHLVDLAFVILISLVPSIIIMAYFHGMPGRNRWRTLEKIYIPVNILVSILLVIFIFKGTDFGRISQKVTLQDETGQTIQREIPKSEYLKKITLFFFDNTSGDAALDWLQYGIVYMLQLDLNQDLFVTVITPAEGGGITNLDYYVLDKIREAGFKRGVGLPLLLKRKIAAQFNMDYFLSGKISKEQHDYILELSLYNTQNAKRLANTSFRGNDSDVLKQIDDMTVWIKKRMEIPTSHIEKVSDLPLAEMFTRSLSAARSYTLATNAIIFENDWSTAQQHYNKSLREDPDFTFARLWLAGVYEMSNQGEKIPGLFQTVMQQLYKLPERQQLYVKLGYYGTKGDTDKQIALLRMIIKLYPRDIRAYSRLAVFLNLKNQYDEAISQYKRILEIDPGRHEMFQSIGKLYESKGDLQQALSYYKTYLTHSPNDPGSFNSIGHLYEKMGDHQQAKSYYEKALLLKPDDITVLINLADIEIHLGHFDQAYQQYQDALKLSKIPKDKTAVYEELANLCKLRGQMKKSLEYTRLQFNMMKEYMPPFMVYVFTTLYIGHYIWAGEEQEAFRILETYKQQMKPPYDFYIPIGYILAYLELERVDEAETLFPRVVETIEKMGLKKLENFTYFVGGRILKQKGEYTKAIESFQKGLAIVPSQENLLRRIGQCFRELKQYEKAEKNLQAALKQEPYHPNTNFELALLYLDMNNKEKALNHLKVAVDVWQDADEGYKPALQARKTLEQLQQN